MENYQKEIEKVLQDMQKEDYERLINTAECGIMILKMLAEPEILYANNYFYTSLQYTKEEYFARFGKNALGPVVPEEKQKLKALIARQAAAGGSIHLKLKAMRKDGSIVWMSFTAKSDRNQGEMVYYCSCLDISVSERHLEDVYKAKKEVDLIANSIPGGVIKLRMSDFYLLYANDGFFRLAGYSRSEYSIQFHNCCASMLHPEDADMVKQIVKQAVDNRGPLGLEYRIINKNGEVRWSYINGTRIDDENGEAVYLCVIVDITSRKQAEYELADNSHRAEVITHMLKETVWTYDVAKRRLKRSGDLGSTYSPESILEGGFFKGNIKGFIHPEDLDRFIEVKDSWINQLGETRDIFRVRNDKGEYYRVEICARAEAKVGNKPDKVYGFTRLVTENEATTPLEEQVVTESSANHMEGKLLKMAKTAQASSQDNITGLLPYATFLKKAEQVLSERKEEEHYALICADINEFHKFSHHYGFSISNHILKIFSEVLLNNLAKDGMCSRVDGDYFVVLFQYVSHKELLKAMSAVVRRQEEMEKQDEFMEFGSTIGMYLVQKEDHELLDMLEKADLARRSIKGLTGNHYAIYTDEVAKNMSHEGEMVEDIRKAMQEDTVEVNYLPRIQGDKENVVGCKAIARVLMRNGQYLESPHVMHLVEHGAQLEEFNFYVLSVVARNLGIWKTCGKKILPVSVEMTASQLGSAKAVKRIHDIVTKNGLSPEEFIFEISERFFEGGSSTFEMAIETLCELGYKVIISRFGTDHTAVHMLRRLPVAGIKFHGEYFSEHMINEKDTIVLRKIVEMAQEMGMMVICGGIHTRLQEEYARKIGCEILEGNVYYGAVKNVVFEKCFLD